MNKKQLMALFIVLLIALSFMAIGVYGKCVGIEEDVHEEKIRIVCDALDANKSCIDIVRAYHNNGEFDAECQEELVKHINLLVDDYENAYVRYRDMVGDIPRESTLPRVSITPMPTIVPTTTSTPTPTLTPTPTCTPTPTSTCTPTPTLTPTPTPEPTPIEVGKIALYTSDVNKEEYTDGTISIDGLENVPIKVRWRGNSSTWMKKKSYNIKFTDKIDLYEMGEGKKWCLLATAYEKSLLRTPLGLWYANQIGLPYVSEFRFTELWLNDSYKGVYLLTEPVEDGKSRVDLNLNKGDFLIECSTIREDSDKCYVTTNAGFKFELNEPESPSNSDKQFIEDTLNQIETAIMTKDYDTYKDYIDVESFVNYYIFEELTKNVDFGRLSTRYFCKDGKLYAGPPWDLDLTMGNVSVTHEESIYRKYNNYNTSMDSTEGLWVNDVTWYKWLCEDSYFLQLVRDRWNELYPITRSLAYDEDDKSSRIKFYVDTYGSYLEKNYMSKSDGGAGWVVGKQSLLIDYDYPADTYLGNLHQLREWLPKRISSLHNEFNKQNNTGCVPIARYGDIAQLGERLPCKQEVMGSSPVISTCSILPSPGVCNTSSVLHRYTTT